MTAEIKPGVRYRMPTVFGPAPGPRQKADGTPWRPEETGTMNGHWLTVRYRTHAGQLAKLLPPGFALQGEPLVPPEKIASTAVFLASQAAAAISGQALSVDNDAHYMA